MSRLQVRSAHLDGLSTQHGGAAAGTTATSTVTDGVTQSMWASHGVVCAPANLAVTAAAEARTQACAAMSAVSSDLQRKLTSAGRRYDGTDAAGETDLDRQVRWC